jgi:hypothetical protein
MDEDLERERESRSGIWNQGRVISHQGTEAAGIYGVDIKIEAVICGITES